MVVRQQLLGESIYASWFQAPGTPLNKVGLHHSQCHVAEFKPQRYGDKVDTLTLTF